MQRTDDSHPLSQHFLFRNDEIEGEGRREEGQVREAGGASLCARWYKLGKSYRKR